MTSSRLACLLLLLSLAFSACKSSREVSSVRGNRFSPDSLMVELGKNSRQYEWFSAKARVNYEDKSVSKSFTAYIRMRKDSVLWISITTILGVEAARLLIKRDSVSFIDRLNKKFSHEPLSFLEQYAPFPFDIALLQKILTGDAMLLPSEQVKVKQEKNQYVLFSQNNQFKHTLNLDTANLTISTEHLSDIQDDRSVSLVFDDYKSTGDGLFSYVRNISFQGDAPIKLSLKFSKVEWDVPLTFPFRVGENYEEY